MQRMANKASVTTATSKLLINLASAGSQCMELLLLPFYQRKVVREVEAGSAVPPKIAPLDWLLVLGINACLMQQLMA